MSDVSKSQKRKNKKKYYQSSKKSKFSVLESGMKGFLITCNDEFRCAKEAYNLLNEFADEIYGPEFNDSPKKDFDAIDIEDQLAKDIAVFKSNARRFQRVTTKVKNILFISTTIADPELLVNKIFTNFIETGKKKARFIFKLKPVSVTCKVQESDIKKSIECIFQNMSPEEIDQETTYKVESKVRNNDSITSSHMIWYVRDVLTSAAPKWTACLLEPQIVISFDVLRTVCCISVLKKYSEYKKYNLSEAISPVMINKPEISAPVENNVHSENDSSLAENSEQVS